MASFDSEFYPYSVVPNPNNTLKGAEEIPKQILMYLLDLSDSNGYQPVDDNARARVRLIKYLMYDDPDPLDNPLPTVQQKLSCLFNPAYPDLNTDELIAQHPFGYRMIWQHVIKQSVLEEKTYLKCYIGRVFTPKPYHTTIGIQFEIWTGAGLESNIVTGVESRTFAIEQCIRQALAPINMTGVGAFSFYRGDHSNNGSSSLYTEGSVVGRGLHCSIDWVDADAQEVNGMCDVC